MIVSKTRLIQSIAISAVQIIVFHERAGVAFLSFNIIGQRTTVTVSMSVVPSVAVESGMTVIGSIDGFLTLNIEGDGATVSVSVSVAISESIDSTVVSVNASSDLLVDYFSDFGFFGNGCSRQNSQKDLI